MRFERFGGQYVIRLDPGEEVMGSLRAFAAREGIRGAYFLAIGAFSRVRLRYFDVAQKRYLDRDVDEQVEVVSLLGSIARDDRGQPLLHVHVSVSDAQTRAHNGHLAEGLVRPTLEVFLTALDGEIRRARDPETGLQLLALEHALRR
jgi:predicted DNA-binding protein with PD1-like motif